MERLNDDLLERWLRAEEEASGAAADADDAADLALTALFASLPLSSPAPGFEDRLVASLAPLPPLLPAPAPRPFAERAPALLPAFLSSRWGRVSLGVGLAAAALGLPFLGRALWVLLASLRPALLAPALARVLNAVGGWMISGLHLWRWFAAFSRSLLLPLESPVVAAALGGCLLVSALALRLLHDVIQHERNYSYADPV